MFPPSSHPQLLDHPNVVVIADTDIVVLVLEWLCGSTFSTVLCCFEMTLVCSDPLSVFFVCLFLVLKRTTSNCCNIIIITLEGQRFKV